MSEKHVLGGRTFVPVSESTVEHDYHFLALLHRAGLGDVELLPGETGGVFAERILRQVIASGQVRPLLGCLLVPEPAAGTPTRPPGELWTPEMGQDTARYLGGLIEEQDKAMVRSLVISLLIDFFQSGLSSLRASATSSAEGVSPIPDSAADTVTGAS